MGISKKTIGLLIATISMLPATVFAQLPDSVDPRGPETAMAAKGEDSTLTKSGYEQVPSLEGGDSVTQDLAQDDVKVGAVLRAGPIKEFFDPWFDAKRSLNEKYGLKLQFSYQALYQNADSSLGEDEAAAGRVEAQGAWTLLGRGTKNPGVLSFRLEDRHTLGTEIPPTQLGAQFGSASQTGTGFSDFGTALTEIAWRQTLLSGRMKFVVGKISAISWYNAHALSSPKRSFQNTALQSSLSKPAPGRGIGGGAATRLGSRFVVLAGIHDANARAPDNPFDTIDENEFYKSLEIRWLPTTFERSRWDKVQVQIWHQDERADKGIPSGQGVTFSASRLYQDFWMPFILGGVSDGDASIFDADLVAGVGFGFQPIHGTARDVLAFAVGWGRPSDEELQEQYTAEVFYRFPLVGNLVITPSAQLIVNPANNPDEDKVWVLGARIRLTF